MPAHNLRTELDSNRTTTSRMFRMPARVIALLCALAAVAVLSGCGSSSSSSRAVSVARSHIGAPYVYGAAGPRSFDCSGFTMYVYRQVGRSLPHNSSAQYSSVSHVSKSSARPGDLIFFGSPGAIYHVGVYAGRGQVIDAPKTGSSVSQRSIWTSSYVVGRP